MCRGFVFSNWVCFRIGFGYNFEGYRNGFMDYYDIKTIGLSWDLCGGFRVQGSGFRIKVSIIDMRVIPRFL